MPPRPVHPLADEIEAQEALDRQHLKARHDAMQTPEVRAEDAAAASDRADFSHGQIVDELASDRALYTRIALTAGFLIELSPAGEGFRPSVRYAFRDAPAEDAYAQALVAESIALMHIAGQQREATGLPTASEDQMALIREVSHSQSENLDGQDALYVINARELSLEIYEKLADSDLYSLTSFGINPGHAKELAKCLIQRSGRALMHASMKGIASPVWELLLKAASAALATATGDLDIESLDNTVNLVPVRKNVPRGDRSEITVVKERDRQLIGEFAKRAGDHTFTDAFAAFMAKSSGGLSRIRRLTEMVEHERFKFLLGATSDDVSEQEINAFLSANNDTRFDSETHAEVCRALNHFKRELKGQFFFATADGDSVPCTLTSDLQATHNSRQFRIRSTGSQPKTLSATLCLPQELTFGISRKIAKRGLDR